MEWFVTVLAVVVIGLAVAAGAGRFGQFGGPVAKGNPPLVLPEGRMTGADVAGVRFNVVSKGYAMDQVDEFLARIQEQLEEITAPSNENLE